MPNRPKFTVRQCARLARGSVDQRLQTYMLQPEMLPSLMTPEECAIQHHVCLAALLAGHPQYRVLSEDKYRDPNTFDRWVADQERRNRSITGDPGVQIDADPTSTPILASA